MIFYFPPPVNNNINSWTTSNIFTFVMPAAHIYKKTIAERENVGKCMRERGGCCIHSLILLDFPLIFESGIITVPII